MREQEQMRLVELTDSFLQEELGACLNKKILRKFAKHLLDKGAVVPPVKVGQTMYLLVGKALRHIAEVKVTYIAFTDKEYFFGIESINSKNQDSCWHNDIGRKIFLTREEAEKAIERSGEK